MSSLLRTVGWLSSIWGGLNAAYCIYRVIAALLMLGRLARLDVAQREPAFGLTRGCIITTIVFYLIWCVLAILTMRGGIAILRRSNRSLLLVTHFPGAIAGVGLIGGITLLAFERLGAQALAYMLGFGLAFVLGLALTIFNNFVLRQKKHRNELDA